jgi:hypothetical protein
LTLNLAEQVGAPETAQRSLSRLDRRQRSYICCADGSGEESWPNFLGLAFRSPQARQRQNLPRFQKTRPETGVVQDVR